MLKALIPIVFITVINLTYSQIETIKLFSIQDARENQGDHGYTLDGQTMVNARAKIFNLDNFGKGVFNKKVQIYDRFGASGDLEKINQLVGKNDMFFFGGFDRANLSLYQFTQNELDSLYNWSLNGGKMIIGANASFSNFFVSFYLDILNQKWGFDLVLEVSDVTPTEIGKTLLFNGPFGYASVVKQGGSSQGYFSKLPPKAVVLGVNKNNKPSVFIDCTTLDLIVSDVDMYTILGGISQSNNITSKNDIFLANSIVFMDQLEDHPVVKFERNHLIVKEYKSYQWYKGENLIDGATNQSYLPKEIGKYKVKVKLKCGCELISGFFEVNSSIEVFPNPFENSFTIHGLLNYAEIFDNKGALIKKVYPLNDGFNVDMHNYSRGTYLVRGVYNKNTYSTKVIKK